MTWTIADVDIVFDDLTDDPVVTAEIATPLGSLRVMAEVSRTGRALRFEGFHIHADDLSINTFGARRLMETLRVLLELLDVDEIIIGGAVRTTGARPGHRPRDVRVVRSI